MRRSLLVVAGAAALVLVPVLSACSVADPYAIKVNDDEVSRGDYLQQLSDLKSNTEWATGNDLPGAGAGTVKADFSTQVAGLNIREMLVSQELERRGITVTDAELAEAEQQVAAGFGEAWNGFPQRFRTFYVRAVAEEQALRKAVAAVPDDTALRALYDASPGSFGEICASHILVATEDEALAVKAELDGGADFAALAEQRSSDGSAAQGGRLTTPEGACYRGNDLVPEFTNAALAATPGVPTAPVQSQFGWHVIKVDEIKILPFEEVRDAVAAVAARESQTAYTELVSQLGRSNVRIDPRFGIWDPLSGNVLPPNAEAFLTENQQSEG